MRKDNIIGAHQYWAAAFIDILGQREAMREIYFVPNKENSQQMEKFNAEIKKVYGAVKLIHDLFQNYFKSTKSVRTPSIQPNEEQMKIWHTLHDPPLKHQRFSDGLMFYLSLADFIERSPVVGIYHFIVACASVLLSSLEGKTPIRGGIDVGTGMEINPNELYGPVMTKTYELESKIAQYPRVVVGDELINYLKSLERSEEKGEKPEFERVMARMCLNLIMVDIDGFPAIDFLGDGIHQLARPDDYQLFSMAYQFVVEQLEESKKKRNTTLSFRYSQLLNYFEAKKDRWVNEIPKRCP